MLSTSNLELAAGPRPSRGPQKEPPRSPLLSSARGFTAGAPSICSGLRDGAPLMIIISDSEALQNSPGQRQPPSPLPSPFACASIPHPLTQKTPPPKVWTSTPPVRTPAPLLEKWPRSTSGLGVGASRSILPGAPDCLGLALCIRLFLLSKFQVQTRSSRFKRSVVSFFFL